MKRLAPLAAAAIMLAASGNGLADPVTKAPTIADYEALAKLPDWTGTWQPDWQSMFSGAGGRKPIEPALTPAAAKIMADYKSGQARGENLQGEAANCVPVGMPQIMRMPYPIEVIYSPGRVTIATETYSQVRRIYTDGRPLPADPDPAFNGSSIGRWDGDTLIVETVGLNAQTSLIPGLHPTEKTRIEERMRLVQPDLLQVTTTITDPGLFTQPLVLTQNYARKRDWQIREYVCEENNRDAADPFGRPSMDISKR